MNQMGGLQPNAPHTGGNIAAHASRFRVDPPAQAQMGSQAAQDFEGYDRSTIAFLIHAESQSGARIKKFEIHQGPASPVAMPEG